MTSLSATKSSGRRPVITIFTSIASIGQALRQQQTPETIEHGASPPLPLLLLDEIIDEEALFGYGGTVEFNPSKLQAKSVEQLKRAEILITEPAVLASLLHHYEGKVTDILPKLKWCQATYAGVDPLFKPHSREDSSQPAVRLPLPLPFTLTRFAGVFGPPIAEWTLARIIGHERRFNLTAHDQRSDPPQWAASKRILEYRYLSDLTLVVLGCGDIGMCIARTAKAFGMRVVGYSRTPKACNDSTGLDESVTDLSTALQAGDYVVSVLPSTNHTRGVLHLEQFQAANVTQGGKSPVFINVGRGDVTDTPTLMAALDANHISAAILDVFGQEPLPVENPLWKHPRVTVSPHVSGLTRAQDVPNFVMDQYERYVHGQPLQFVVDWDKSY